MGLVLHSGLCKRCQVKSHFGHSHHHGDSEHNDHPLTHSAPAPISEEDSAVTTVVIDPKQNINVRAAMVHVIGDLFQSFGVLIAAVIIKVEVSILSNKR